jgi:lipopolysaccharide transport system ATP-binding protein
MLDEVVVRVESLGKNYVIGSRAEPERYLSLRDVIARNMTRAASKLVRNASAIIHGRRIVRGSEVKNFWALKDVNFEVRQGEVLGVIGRNGAGKSTLLKILCRVTEPSSGRITIRGRVASLLEIGAGFHPELSGRENIYLNAAILGMSRYETSRKLDEIVAFAGVEKFLHTPVKRYSSGMYMRLAFAVAAHVEPDVLLIDEVLAVGDLDFQKKCLGKMRSASKIEGRTVVFVSHQMSAVAALCSHAIWLDGGRIVDSGEAKKVIKGYVLDAEKSSNVYFGPTPGRPAITRIVLDRTAVAKGNFAVDIYFESPYNLAPPIPGVVISSLEGTPIFGSNTCYHREGYPMVPRRSGKLRFEAEGLPLTGGTYLLSVWLSERGVDHDCKEQILQFDFPGRSLDSMKGAYVAGSLDWPARWSAE